MKKNTRSFFVIIALLLLQSSTKSYAIINSAITVTSITNISAQIYWTTDILSDSTIVYGVKSQTYTLTPQSRCDGAVPTTKHCIYLTNLTPGTTYYYKIVEPASATAPAPAGGIVPATGTTLENYFTTLAIGLNTTTAQANGLAPGTAGTIQTVTTLAPTTPNVITPAPVTNTTTSASPSTVTTAPIVNVSFGAPTTTSPPVTTPPVLTTLPTTALVVPIAPSNAVATLTSSGGSGMNSIRIEWLDNSSDETSFKIYRSFVTGSIATSSQFTLKANEKKYDDTNLQSGTYIYYVLACNAVGCSAASATKSIVVTSTAQNTATTPVITNPTTTPTPVTTPLTTVPVTTIPVSNTPVDTTVPVLTTIPSVVTTPPQSVEISNALGKAIPGSFINIVPVNSTSLTLSYSATVSTDGTFAINVPDGTYTVEGFIPIGSTASSVLKKIILLNGKATVTNDQVIVGTKKINGSVTSTDNSPITDAEVGAYKKETGEWISVLTDSNGRFTLTVSPGTWDILIQPKTGSSVLWDANQVVPPVTFANNADNEEQNVTLQVTPLTSKLIINVTDDTGTPLPNIGIILDTTSVTTPLTALSGIRRVRTEKTDSHGSITIQDIPGTYYLRTSSANNSQLIEAYEQQVNLGKNEVNTLSIILKKETMLSLTTLAGIVKFDDNTTTDAFISAWSDQGGHEQTTSLLDGTYSFNLATNQTWHISAHKDNLQKSYSTDEQTVTTTKSKQSLDLIFIKNQATVLPQTVTTTQAPTQQTMVSVDDGARFTLPANAVTSASSIAVEVKPTTEAPSHALSNVVSTAYDITVKNTASGQKISQLSSLAEILLPYDEAELKAKGVALENVVPSYYDETTSSWTSVTNFTINKEKKVFVLHVNHLTRFALIAATDTKAPSSPTNIVADYVTPTDVKITWKNPTEDIHHSKIYRSDTFGVFGNIVAAEVFSNSFIDKTNNNTAKTYYYTVRTVDSAGNESTNSTQLAFLSKGSQFASINASSSLLLPPGQISLSDDSTVLDLGSRGDDVISVQKALKLDGFYTSGPITGYYGKLTKNAVIRFQNYYKNEILIPNGFKKPTGMVGPATRKKIQEILATNNG
jgi:hypothetical protein